MPEGTRLRPRGLPSAALGIAGLLVLGIAWRMLRYGLAFPIWGDEAFVAVNFLTRDFAGMVRPLEYGQIVPLAFMWAELGISKLLGVGELGLRLLPLLAGIAALLLFAWFARRAVSAPAALIAIGILAASYYPVRHGAEVKPYTIDLLTATAMVALGWQALRPDRGNSGGWFAGRGVWIALVALALVAPWCSYPSIFVGGGLAIVMLVRAVRHANDRRLLAPALAFGAALSVSFALMYGNYGAPHAQAAARLMEIQMWAKTFPPVHLLVEGWSGLSDFPARMAKWAVYMHTGNMLAYPAGGEAPGSAGTLALVVLGALRLRRSKPQLVALLLLPLVLTFIAAAFKRYPYGGSVRTSIYMAPSFCLLAGVGVVALAGGILRALGANRFVGWDNLRTALHRVGWVACAALVVGMVVGAARDVREPFKTRDVQLGREAIRGLAARTKPGDQWIVYNSPTPVAWAPWLGDLHGGGQFVFDVLRYHPATLRWSPPPAEIRPSEGGRLFVLVYRGLKADLLESQLKSYLDMIQAQTGEPVFERTPLKEREGRVEAIDVHVFEVPAK